MNIQTRFFRLDPPHIKTSTSRAEGYSATELETAQAPRQDYGLHQSSDLTRIQDELDETDIAIADLVQAVIQGTELENDVRYASPISKELFNSLNDPNHYLSELRNEEELTQYLHSVIGTAPKPKLQLNLPEHLVAIANILHGGAFIDSEITMVQEKLRKVATGGTPWNL